MTLIRCDNSGPVLTGSNYWESEMERAGFYYLSPNAGTLRLLVPHSRESEIRDMLSARECVITKGFHRDHRRELYELLFDDHSKTPFVLLLSPEQLERNLSTEEFRSAARHLVLYSFGPSPQGEMKCYLREGTLPCMKTLDSLSR